MTQDAGMLLWHTALQRHRNYVYSCTGDFTIDKDVNPVSAAGDSTRDDRSNVKYSGKRRKELQLCLATQNCVELYDVSEGSLQSLGKWPISATILSMSKLNLDKCPHTILVLMTDSGNLTFWKFERDSLSGKVFPRTLANEPIWRSGIRRYAPQSYMACDKQSRCVFLGGLERTKMCVLTDWQHGKLVVSSPVELQRQNRVTLAMASCDVGFDNPVTAAIELENETSDCYISFYTMDLGLNSLMLRKEFVQEDKSANFVMPCPNLGQYKIRTRPTSSSSSTYENEDEMINPFVLCGYDGYLTLRDLEGFYEVSVQLPVRKNVSSTNIINGVVHKLKKEFFILVQSNCGDLYKVTIVPDAETLEPVMEIVYFDTIPPSESVHIFKTGTLFNVSEFGTSHLMQFESLGEDLEKTTSYTPGRRIFIEPRTRLQNLSVLSSLRSLNPLTSLHVTKSTPLTLLAAANDSGSVSKLTSAIDFEELISTALPHAASRLWTVKVPVKETHSLVLLSTETSTTVLKVHSGTIEDFSGPSCPFTLDKATLFVGTMGEKSIIQVTADQLLQITESKDNSTYSKKLEWLPPAGVNIVTAFCNETQLVVSLSNHEICYLEILDESLNELQKRLELDSLVNCISLTTGVRSQYCVLGCDDHSLQILNLQPKHSDFFTVCAMQSLISKPHSLVFVRDSSHLKIHIGMKNGVYASSKLNISDGTVFDVRTKLVGTKPVNVSLLSSIDINYIEEDDEAEEEEEQEEESKSVSSSKRKKESSDFIPVVVLNSNVSWMTYENDNRIVLRPLKTKEAKVLRTVASFITDDIGHNGCCSITNKGHLLIGKLTHFLSWDNWFNEERLALSSNDKGGKEEDDDEDDENEDEDEDEDDTDRCEIFHYQNQKLVKDSIDDTLCYVVSKDSNNQTLLTVIRNDQVLATSNQETSLKVLDEPFRAVTSCNFGTTAKYLVLSTSSGKLVTIQVRVKNNVLQIEFVHETLLESSSLYAMVPFQDKLACCIQGNIVLLALGKKQLLKKSITQMPPHITQVTAMDQWDGQHLAVGDIAESVTLFKYDVKNNVFEGVADDNMKKHVTSIKFLDESTVIGGDRFGNCWVLRVDYNNISRVAANIKTCHYTLDTLCHMYMNDTPIQFEVVKNMDMSDRQSILWIGLQGTIGCFVPLVTRKEQQLFESFQFTYAELDFLDFQDRNKHEEVDLEEMEGALDEREKTYHSNSNGNDEERIVEGVISRVGRDFLNYRSYYSPLKNIIDGETLEQFSKYTPSEQKWIASKMKHADGQVETFNKFINEMRTNYL